MKTTNRHGHFLSCLLQLQTVDLDAISTIYHHHLGRKLSGALSVLDKEGLRQDELYNSIICGKCATLRYHYNFGVNNNNSMCGLVVNINKLGTISAKM